VVHTRQDFQQKQKYIPDCFARYFLNEAEERLQNIQQEAKRAEEKRNKIYEDITK
jgi:hypothetical protein